MIRNNFDRKSHIAKLWLILILNVGILIYQTLFNKILKPNLKTLIQHVDICRQIPI